MEFENVYDDKNKRKLQEEFPQLSGVTYLDHAGSTIFSKTQIESVSMELKGSSFFNLHTNGTKNNSTKVVAEASILVLKHLNAEPEEYSVIFTSGATSGMKISGECFALLLGLGLLLRGT